jgi:hemerythrin
MSLIAASESECWFFLLRTRGADCFDRGGMRRGRRWYSKGRFHLIGFNSLAYFDWNEDVAIGHPQIDDQHKQMFALAEAVTESLFSSPEQRPRDANLQALIDCTRAHFAFEEALMKELAYPEAESHANYHASLLTELETYCARVRRQSHTNPAGMVAFLWRWLAIHIHSADRELVAWIGSR